MREKASEGVSLRRTTRGGVFESVMVWVNVYVSVKLILTHLSLFSSAVEQY